MAVVRGASLTFAIANDELSLTTTKVTWSKKIDKKEARNRTGDVVAVAYYNETHEVSVEGWGTSAASLGATIALTGIDPVGTQQFLEELTIDLGNEEFVKTTAKIMSYTGI